METRIRFRMLPPICADRTGSAEEGESANGNGFHSFSHIRDLPSRQVRHVDRLALAALAQLARVVARRGAVGRSRPRMMQNVARLEVAAVAGLLEDEIFREVLAVVADMQPGEERSEERRVGKEC